jgi:hypothetical protein
VENPAIFENYTKIQRIQDTIKLRDMNSMAQEVSSYSPNGVRNSYWTTTFRINKEMIKAAVDILQEEAGPLKEIEGIVPAFVIQPITTDVIARFGKNGGNCLGIDANEGPLVNINYSMMWKNAEDDEVVLGAMRTTMKRIIERSKEMGVYHPFLYQNYASIEQDVFAGYGEENRRKLREISKKYDPDQVFQTLQPGYFKL